MQINQPKGTVADLTPAARKVLDAFLLALPSWREAFKNGMSQERYLHGCHQLMDAGLIWMHHEQGRLRLGRAGRDKPPRPTFVPDTAQ